MLTLAGKTVAVTGASSGIGEALARLLANEGATVVVCARRLEILEKLQHEINAGGGKCLAVQCDVSQPDQAAEFVHETVRKTGAIDILINNAGRGHFSTVEETTDEMIESMFAVNVFALWYTVRPALTYMKPRGSGHIINVASMAGKIGYPYNSAYVAAKHACVGFTHALRSELMETGVHASVVCPGSVATPWADVTEGGAMRSMFSASREHILRSATERQITLPSIEGIKSAEEIARAILACIRHPVPEVYTHRGSNEFVQLASADLEKAEYQLLPIVLGEREVYRQLKSDRGGKIA
jgi:uncharacterized protein